MLQGSLDNFALDEVLSLLSTTQKTGHLALSGDRGTGSLWLETGEIVGADASNLEEASASDDVMFELLRFESGSFLFTMDQRLDDPGVAESVDLLLGTAKDRIVEWRTIEAVVPSLSHDLWLIKSLEADEILLSRQDWDAVVAVGEGNTVGNVCSLLDLDEVDGSRRIKGLIERGVITISEPAETISVPASSSGLFSAPVATAPVEFARPAADFAVAGVVESTDEFEFLDHDAISAHDPINGAGAHDSSNEDSADLSHVETESIAAMFAEEPAETASFGESLADAGVSADDLFSGVDAIDAPVHHDDAADIASASPMAEAPPAPSFDETAPSFEAPAAPAFDAAEFDAPESEAPEFEASEFDGSEFDAPAPASEASASETSDSETPAFDEPAFDAPPAFGSVPEMPSRPPMPAPPAIGADGSIQSPPPPPPPSAADAFGEFTESAEEEASLLMRYLKSESH